MKREKEIREEMLQEMKKTMKALNETDLIVFGCFNEDVSAKNMHDFVIETVSCEVFSELNHVELSNRDGTFEHGSKCINHVLGSEGFLNVVANIKLIEHNEIMDSDHRRCLVDLNLEARFEEEFNTEKEI